MTRAELPTPALLLDLDRFERNIQKMAAHVKAAGKKIRPHAKTHKCPEIARRQVAAGAVGVCVAKVGEAEAMAAAGVRNLLITTEVVGPEKIGRLLGVLRRQPETLVVVSSDMSHYHPYEVARACDRDTAQAILRLDPRLVPEEACGAAPINGLLEAARRRKLAPELVDLRNSGDTAGDRSRVVGYGAFAFTEPAHA